MIHINKRCAPFQWQGKVTYDKVLFWHKCMFDMLIVLRHSLPSPRCSHSHRDSLSWKWHAVPLLFAPSLPLGGVPCQEPPGEGRGLMALFHYHYGCPLIPSWWVRVNICLGCKGMVNQQSVRVFSPFHLWRSVLPWLYNAVCTYFCDRHQPWLCVYCVLHCSQICKFMLNSFCLWENSLFFHKVHLSL